MMKWWKDYEHASDLYDAVQKHQQSFKNHYVYPIGGTYKLKNRSIEFIFPKKMPSGFVFERWSHTIFLRDRK